jgi:hypothetical protein
VVGRIVSDIPAFAAFVNDLEANPGIKSVTASTSVPGAEVGGSSGFTLKILQQKKMQGLWYR